MKYLTKHLIHASVNRRYIDRLTIAFILFCSLLVSAQSSASKSGENKDEFYGSFLLRYESVEQNNPLEDADALTLRTSLGYKSASYQGFSAHVEVEDVREIIDDFSVPPAGVRPGQFSVVADPEGTEIDQAYVKYANDKLWVKLGRQVITLDGHRFIGSVAWRQDHQTFDGVTLNYKPLDGLNINASYIAKRNRIFSDEADLDSKDMIINSSYKTPVGKIVGYAYLLEVDNGTDNSIDTYGVSFTGSAPSEDYTLHYAAEYATQDINDTFDTDYLKLEGGVSISGITAKIGYEELGSDNGQKGFTTPLATLHKFNGWADLFLATPDQGLQDLYLRIGGKLAGGKWLAAYHDFSSDSALNGADDLGDEINLLYTRKFTEGISGGVKYADYSAGDSAFSRVDTERFWLWAKYKF